ncbi:hypothetical protein EIK77_002995 [Talaromyces pinophilus]|nr:hypothetical protein EIK77_002995 [Talaromyces pinophilus]
MRFLSIAAGLLSTSCSILACAAESSNSNAQTPLAKDFKPPQVFKNTNLVRNTNLEKGYVRETINVVVENIDKKPQTDYYVPFPADVFSHIGGFEVRNKKSPEKGSFPVTAVEVDGDRFVCDNAAMRTVPLPKSIGQSDSQFLTYTLNAYAPSAYEVETQKTKVKFPSSNVPDYTTTSKLKTGNDPEKQGSTLTYGPYTKVTPGATYPLSFRFESTKPVLASSLLERDIEVSHWGGNLAIEERYWLRNDGANLSKNFDRVEWARQSYGLGASSALQELKYPLKPGSVDPYFTDDVGNVSTSRYRPGNPGREAHLELKPRYPVFGGWKYSFRVGWNNGLSSFLRKVGAESYVLKVPFIEGPKVAEGIQYDQVVVRVILPEGATDIKYEILDGDAPNGLPDSSHIQSSISKHRTYMDTIGRSALTLKVDNLSDEARGSQLLVCLTPFFFFG